MIHSVNVSESWFMTISTWWEFPTLTKVITFLVVALTCIIQRTKWRKMLSCQPQFTIRDPQTSLPYVKIGLIIKSKRLNNISGGISQIAWTLLFIAKVAFLAWSQNRRGALLFIKVIHQISRPHWLKNIRFEANLSKITRSVAAIKSLRCALFPPFLKKYLTKAVESNPKNVDKILDKCICMVYLVGLTLGPCAKLSTYLNTNSYRKRNPAGYLYSILITLPVNGLGLVLQAQLPIARQGTPTSPISAMQSANRPTSTWCSTLSIPVTGLLWKWTSTVVIGGLGSLWMPLKGWVGMHSSSWPNMASMRLWVDRWDVVSLCFNLTHCGRDQIDAISQTTYSNAFSRMKMNEFHLGFHWSLFLRFELTIFQHWFR